MKTNEELLAEANEIEFSFTKNGRVNPARHTKYELGLYAIKRAIERHGIEKYLYGRVLYVNTTTKTTVVCPTHGDFEISPSNLINGRGCPKCNPKYFSGSKGISYYDDQEDSYALSTSRLEVSRSDAESFLLHTARHTEQMYESEEKAQRKKKQKESFIKRAKELHKEKYDYSQVFYKNAREKVRILCPQHGPFHQTPDCHLSGKGCPKCGGHNHDILYLLKCNDTGWHKIGITTNSTKNRISSIGGNMEEIYHIKLEDPRHHEGFLHQKYKEVRKTNLYVNNGNTEFFLLTEEQVQEVINYMKEL